MNNNILYIFTILEAVEKIKIYTKDFNSSDELFEANNQKEFNAVLNLLIAIGEESKKIEDNLKSENIKWKDISALRNILSHNYRGIDKDIIWDIVKNYLDDLKSESMKLFLKIKPDKETIIKILDSKYYRNIQYLKDK